MLHIIYAEQVAGIQVDHMTAITEEGITGQDTRGTNFQYNPGKQQSMNINQKLIH